MGFPRKLKGQTRKHIEKIIAENFPNLGRETGIQIQEIERSPPKINKNCSTPRHLIVKLANSKDKERILKVARDKRSLTYMGRNNRLTADFPTETWQARKGWQNIFRVLNEKNVQPRILYPVRLSFRIEEEIKSFQDRQKLKQYQLFHQTSSAGNIKGDFVKERGSPKK